MNTEQKYRNNAFYSSVLISLVTLLILILGIAQLTILGAIQILIFPILGFFVLKSSKAAAVVLMLLFLLDTVFWIINWLPRIPPFLPSVYTTLLIRFILWWTFYRAYISIKKNK